MVCTKYLMAITFKAGRKMNTFNKFKKNLFLITIFSGISACSSKPVIQNFPPSASPAEEIANLENSIRSAGQKQLHILSPKNYEEARVSLDEAKEYYRKGRDSEITLNEVALGNAYLRNANIAANVARENAGDVVAAREAALKVNAHEYFGREFKKADNDFSKLTRAIEKNKLTKVTKSRTKLQEKYLNLELKAIKEKNLKESREIIALAKKEDAKKFAPRTLAIAERSFLDTESYITANRHDTGDIELRAKKTRDAANHVLKINRIAKGTDKVSTEEIAIAMENEKNRVAMKESQLQKKEGQLEMVEGELDFVEDKLQTTQSALAREKDAERDAKKELEAIKARDEKYELARQEFSSDEAEVYKQGDDLLIRLKGMEFPSSKAIIQTKNYPLLSKVQKIISKFGTGTAVTVEGHTDSIGGKKINEKLSAQRAIAVKEYLESNSGGLESNIEAVGYGDEKTLAAKKTASDRAKNHNVAIIKK
ncbi:MAG: hypothetical protein EHM20_15405, partial [Alphaproteobacteria bacterium]